MNPTKRLREETNRAPSPTDHRLTMGTDGNNHNTKEKKKIKRVQETDQGTEEEVCKPTSDSEWFHQEDDEDSLLKYAIEQSLLCGDINRETVNKTEKEGDKIKPNSSSSWLKEEDDEESQVKYAIELSLSEEADQKLPREEEIKPKSESPSSYQEDEQDCLLKYAIEQSLLSLSSSDLKQKGQIFNSLESIPDSTFEGRVFERGESSMDCVSCWVCKDARPRHKSESILTSNTCPHPVCTDCLLVHIGSQIQELKDDVTKVKCPEPKCQTKFHYESLRRYLPEEVYQRWLRMEQESLALIDPKYIVCPFEDECGKYFTDDRRGYLIKACPHCWRVFCSNCMVGWHLGMGCEEFQKRLQRSKQVEFENRLEHLISRGLMIYHV